MTVARTQPWSADMSQWPSLQAAANWVLDTLESRRVPLRPAIAASRHEIATADEGSLSYYADVRASGRPLVLLHGIHAAASAYEMRPLFEAFRGKRKVYALDLPGFGFSERSARPYNVQSYVNGIEHLLRNVTVREAADVVALSLSSEYAAKVAVEMPEMIRSLTLLSPTGFTAPKRTGVLELLSRRMQNELPGFAELLPSRLLYEMLVSKPSLRAFLRRSFESRVDPELLRYAYATSHQEGAHRAPLAFLFGALFPAGDAKKTYANVRAPSLVLYDRDPYTSFEELDAFVAAHRTFRAQRVLHTRGLPQFDAPQQTLDALRTFYDELDAQHIRGVAGLSFGTRGVVGSA